MLKRYKQYLCTQAQQSRSFVKDRLRSCVPVLVKGNINVTLKQEKANG